MQAGIGDDGADEWKMDAESSGDVERYAFGKRNADENLLCATPVVVCVGVGVVVVDSMNVLLLGDGLGVGSGSGDGLLLCSAVADASVVSGLITVGISSF